MGRSAGNTSQALPTGPLSGDIEGTEPTTPGRRPHGPTKTARADRFGGHGPSHSQRCDPRAGTKMAVITIPTSLPTQANTTSRSLSRTGVTATLPAAAVAEVFVSAARARDV